MKKSILKKEQKLELFYVQEKENKLHQRLEKILNHQLNPKRKKIIIENKFIENILQELNYLKANQKEFEKNLEENLILKQEIILYKERISNQEKIRQSLEATYIDKIDELREKIKEQNKLIEQKDTELNEIKCEKIELIKENSLTKDKIKIIEVSLNEKIQIMKEMDLQLNKFNEKLQNRTRPQLDSTNFLKNNNGEKLKYLLESNLVGNILKFLYPSEILMLKLIDKLFYQLINNDYIYKMIIDFQRNIHKKEIITLKYKFGILFNHLFINY